MKRLIALIAFIGIFSGCAHIFDAAAETAGRRVGEAVGQSIGDRVVGHLSPMLMGWYTNSLFAMAFGSGGYAVGHGEYEPGQWTRWSWVEEGQDAWMERAYLGSDDSDNQWWRVKMYDGEHKDAFVLEGLFSADRGELVRLRRKFPGDAEPVEVPVERDRFYSPPRELTKESLDGAKVGTVAVDVPAGSFTADHIRFGETGGSTWEWWLSDRVPGGVVRYASRAPGSSDTPEDATVNPDDYEVVLVAFGDGASSELGVE